MTVCNQTPIICVFVNAINRYKLYWFRCPLFRVEKNTVRQRLMGDSCVNDSLNSGFCCCCCYFFHQELKLHVRSEELDLKGVMPG